MCETYGAGLLVFHVFCDMRNISEEARCPASSTLICMFIASCAGSYSGSTLANYVFGVRAWHIINGQRWAMDNNQVKATLEGASRLAPPVSKRGQHPPMKREMVEKLNKQLDPNVPLDASVQACLDIMFYSVSRTRVLTVPTQTSFDPAIHIKPSDLRDEVDRNGLKVKVGHLPKTKSAPEGEDIFFAK